MLIFSLSYIDIEQYFDTCLQIKYLLKKMDEIIGYKGKITIFDPFANMFLVFWHYVIPIKSINLQLAFP